MIATAIQADRLTLQELAELWNRAYDGYWFNVQQTPAQLERRLRVTDTDLSRSVVLIADGVAQGFSMLAIRGTTGWIGAFGVVPEARRRGLGHQLVEAQISAAAARATTGLWLEVLQQNHARHLYAAHGFVEQRRLAILSCRVASADLSTPTDLTLRPISSTGLGISTPPALRPAWQRDPGPLVRHADTAIQAFAIEHRGSLLGGVLVERAGRTVRLLHVEAPDCMHGLVLQALTRAEDTDSLLLVNEPEGSPLWTAADRAGWEMLATQIEMWRPGDRQPARTA